MKLSIIVPVYNSGKYLERLLNSVLKSKYEFELICVNDGSTDNSLEILNSFSDKRLQIFSKKNEGVLKTWQYGLSKSQGEYITIFDSDDYIDTDYISYIYNFIENIGADVMFTPYYVEKMDGSKSICKLPIDDGIYLGEKLEAIRKILISGNIPYGKPTKIIKRELLVHQVENTLALEIRDFEDWLTMIQIFSRIQSLYVLNKPFYHYIQYPNSVSKSSSSYEKSFYSLMKVVECLGENTYYKIDKSDIQLIRFYGCRSIFYRSVKIGDKTLAKKILCDKKFRAEIPYSDLPLYEKLLFQIGSMDLFCLCYKMRYIR